MSDPLKTAFAKFLDAVAPYIDDIVVVGGWASRLHRLSPHATAPAFAPLLSDDVDVALSPRIPPRASRLDDLLKAHGFHERLSGGMTPPVTHYGLSEPRGFEVEFLTDLPGSLSRRDGTPDLTAAIAGVTAQKLHYVGLLLHEPWTVDVAASDGYFVGAGTATVRVPNPVSYIVQKLLARKRRGDKWVKDLLYIRDTIEVFGDDGDQFAELWHRLHLRMPEKWRSRCRQVAQELVFPSNADVIDCAMLAASVGRRISANEVSLVLREGLGFLDEGGT